MLLKEEFKANLIYLEPNINAMLYAGEGMYFEGVTHIDAVDLE